MSVFDPKLILDRIRDIPRFPSSSLPSKPVERVAGAQQEAGARSDTAALPVASDASVGLRQHLVSQQKRISPDSSAPSERDEETAGPIGGQMATAALSNPLSTTLQSPRFRNDAGDAGRASFTTRESAAAAAGEGAATAAPAQVQNEGTVLNILAASNSELRDECCRLRELLEISSRARLALEDELRRLRTSFDVLRQEAIDLRRENGDLRRANSTLLDQRNDLLGKINSVHLARSSERDEQMSILSAMESAVKSLGNSMVVKPSFPPHPNRESRKPSVSSVEPPTVGRINLSDLGVDVGGAEMEPSRGLQNRNGPQSEVHAGIDRRSLAASGAPSAATRSAGSLSARRPLEESDQQLLEIERWLESKHIIGTATARSTSSPTGAVSNRRFVAPAAGSAASRTARQSNGFSLLHSSTKPASSFSVSSSASAFPLAASSGAGGPGISTGRSTSREKVRQRVQRPAPSLAQRPVASAARADLPRSGVRVSKSRSPSVPRIGAETAITDRVSEDPIRRSKSSSSRTMVDSDRSSRLRAGRDRMHPPTLEVDLAHDVSL